MKPIIPERLKQARIQAGLSLGQAESLSGITRRAINEMELGNLKPRQLWIAILAEYYGVSEAWLRGEEPPLEVDPRLAAILEKLDPDDRDSLIDLLSSIRQDK